MNVNSKVSVGIIGLGHWGSHILRNFVNHPGIRVAAVCDTSETALSRTAHLIHRDCAVFPRPDGVFANPDVEAVAIATPSSTHFTLVRAALGAGKHVYCEKPLTPDPEECRLLCELAKERDRRLMVGFTFLFNSGIEKVRDLMAAGDLGDIYYMTSVRTHLGLIREDVSSVWDLCPHDVSIMNYLLGSLPERVSAVGSNPLRTGREDFAFISLFYPRGIIGQIHVSWLDASKERLLKIIGSRARIEFDDLDLLEPVRLFQKGIGFAGYVEPDFGGFKYLLRDGDIISPKIEMREPLARMTDAFVRLVRDNEATDADGLFAYDVTRVLSAAHSSMKEQGTPKDIMPLTLPGKGTSDSSRMQGKP